MLYALDIETICAVPGCEDKECRHALDAHRNRITVIGVWRPGESQVFRDLDAFRNWLSVHPGAVFVGHGFKFDVRILRTHGVELPDERWMADTHLQAVALTEKVTPEFMAAYRERREALNKTLKKQKNPTHRAAKEHSLKVLAPFFLGVEPFWEDPTNHDDDIYVLKDCEYTYRLYEMLSQKLKDEGGWEFYETRLLRWTKRLVEMELAGIALDLDLLAEREKDNAAALERVRAELDQHWKEVYEAYAHKERTHLEERYAQMVEKAKSRLKAPTEKKLGAIDTRYASWKTHALEAIEPPNLDSPTDLTWILRDWLGLDIRDFHQEETTGKPVLKKLARTRPDIEVFLKYREHQKLASAFFPSYREMQYRGQLHCSFNPGGARTNRLSSSNPNLQQVPGHLHQLFVARPGRLLITKDASAIEPRLIAYYTKDANLYAIVAGGQDFHGYNARLFFELECPVEEIKEKFPQERKMAKEVGLSLFYGAGTGRLQETSEKFGFHWNKAKCREVLSRFKDFYEGVYEFRDQVIGPCLQRGCATNLLGWPFRIYDPKDIHMTGFNTLIQSSASMLIQESAARAMEMFEARSIDAQILLLVHDEIVTEAPEEHAEECAIIIDEAMTNYDLTTPYGPVKLFTEGKISKSWEK
jgi:DNA polymerase I-like protein with 3'-5' exonuclease and polymerase domains